MYLRVMQCDDSASGFENAPPTECPLFLLQNAHLPPRDFLNDSLTTSRPETVSGTGRTPARIRMLQFFWSRN